MPGGFCLKAVIIFVVYEWAYCWLNKMGCALQNTGFSGHSGM
jgi:hypothetical protein